MGQFWQRKKVRWSMRRAVFLCKVVGTVLSGLEPFLLTEKQEKYLDAVVAGLARIAMGGAACDRTGEHFKSLSTTE
eukprot:350575-Lingulodinium_polyedra.AAC.1